MNKYENGVIKYAIDFERYKNGQANEIISLLDNADKEISKYIKRTSGVYTKARYKEIASKLREISSELKKKVGDNIDVDGIIDYVFKREGKLLSSVGLKDVKYPTAEQVRISALFKPATDGLTYESYLNGIENGLFNTWDSAVRTGYLTGQTTQQIVRNVMGGVSQTEKLKQAGLINPLRNSVYGNTKTLLQSFANETRNMVYEQNEDIFPKDYEKYEYLATLDSRTCLVCGSLDGKLFKNIKDAPQPPLHRGCRCMLIFHFDIEGDTRATANGQKKASISFEEWLKDQDPETQKDVLGSTRYELFKSGDHITQFVDNGRTLTLAELVERGVLNISGGILDKPVKEQVRFAKDYYREIRNRKSKSDIDRIAKNTGFPKEKISDVREYLFNDNKYTLSDGSKSKFSPDARIALAWQRLERGEQTADDILLLNHEYVELTFMKKRNYNYNKAHDLANLRYPWFAKVDKEWIGKSDDEVRKAVRESLKHYL